VLQGALLLLLFRGSHQLEHRLTEKAAGGLQRLFDSVPDRAVVVEVEEGSNAPKVATSQEVRICCCCCCCCCCCTTPGWQLVAVVLAHTVTGGQRIVTAGFGQDWLTWSRSRYMLLLQMLLQHSDFQDVPASTVQPPSPLWFAL
jgi:hypothetical protein